MLIKKLHNNGLQWLNYNEDNTLCMLYNKENAKN